MYDAIFSDEIISIGNKLLAGIFLSKRKKSTKNLIPKYTCFLGF
jgi:hypothetical protein